MSQKKQYFVVVWCPKLPASTSQLIGAPKVAVSHCNMSLIYLPQSSGELLIRCASHQPSLPQLQTLYALIQGTTVNLQWSYGNKSSCRLLISGGWILQFKNRILLFPLCYFSNVICWIFTYSCYSKCLAMGADQLILTYSCSIVWWKPINHVVMKY